MVKKSYRIKISREKREEQKVIFYKDFLANLYNMTKNETTTLLLIIEHAITYNSISFSITQPFYDEMLKKTSIGKNNLNTHLTKLAKRNVIKKIGHLTYSYNPHILYYGDSYLLDFMRDTYDNMINLCIKGE